MFTGSGSGMWETTMLSSQQKPRSLVLQDTRRSFDNLTWRKQLAFARQIYTNCGEIRGPVLERATLANSGGWQPHHVGQRTPKAVVAKYEEWLESWMRVCDIRGEPYDFCTDMFLASVMLDRDGEAPFRTVRDAAGNPRIQWVANHRIYSHWNTYTVLEQTLRDGSPNPYYGMKFNNGVVYDDLSRPVAYFVLDESLMMNQSITGEWVPTNSMAVAYNPDWCDQGRGVTAFAHAIRRIFDTDDIHGYLLLGIKRDSALAIIRSSQEGRVDKAAEIIKGGLNGAGTAISLEEMGGGALWDVGVNSRGQALANYQIAPVQNPRAEAQEYLESIYIGAYQGMNWPYEFSRLSREAKGANIRVTVEKINRSIGNQFNSLCKIAKRKVKFAMGTAVARGELPPGEWWAWEFPQPPEMTADKYHELQEAREEYKLGSTALQLTLSQRGLRMDKIRDMRDADLDDMLSRCKALQAKHPELDFKEILDLYQQRSPNPVKTKEQLQPTEVESKTEETDKE